MNIDGHIKLVKIADMKRHSRALLREKDCGFELVNPNEKLSISNKVAIADPYALTTEEVLFMQVRPKVSNTGKEMLVVTYTTKR